MKKKELNQMPQEELAIKLNELRKELMKSKAQVATGTVPKNPGQIREMKRNVARILTIRRNKKQS